MTTMPYAVLEQVVQRDQHQHGDHPGDHDDRDQPERGVGVQPDQAAHGHRIAPPGHRGAQCVHQHPGPHHRGQHVADGEQRAADRHDALRMGPDGLGHDHAEQRQHAQPGLAQPERGRGQQERHALDRDELALAGADQRRHRRVPRQGQQPPGRRTPPRSVPRWRPRRAARSAAPTAWAAAPGRRPCTAGPGPGRPGRPAHRPARPACPSATRRSGRRRRLPRATSWQPRTPAGRATSWHGRWPAVIGVGRTVRVWAGRTTDGRC